jgi:hypothetical protein
MALDGSEGAIHDLRDFPMRELPMEVKMENHPLFWAEVHQCHRKIQM